MDIGLVAGHLRLGPLKMSLEMAHKVILPPKKIISRSFLNSGTLIVISTYLAIVWLSVFISFFSARYSVGAGILIPFQA